MSGLALPVGDAWTTGTEEEVSFIPECFCPACHGGKAITRMLPTKVPLFRELIIMALECEECNFRNSEITFGGEIQEKGVKFSLKVTSALDLNRQLVKSDSATLLIPSLELEIPPGTQKGTISTIEGMLNRAADNLEELQPERLRLGDVDNFHRCRHVISELRKMSGRRVSEETDEDEGDGAKLEAEDDSELKDFLIILDDPAGNSFVENPHSPNADPGLKREFYFRSATQDMSLGLQPSAEAVKAGTIDDTNPSHKNVASGATKSSHSIEIEVAKKKKEEDTNKNIGRQEAISFPTECPHCRKQSQTDMCVTDIPHFKEVIIMSLMCDHCGFKSNEVKGGGGIPKFGTKCTVVVNSVEDLGREVLKSDTAGIAIPDLELDLEEGSLNGMYTTVEGLMEKLHKNLVEANPFGSISSDSASKHHLTNDGGEFSGPTSTQIKYMQFLEKVKSCAKGEMLPFTLVVNDPLSNSFIGPVPKDAIALALQAEAEDSTACYDAYEDRYLTITEYKRSTDQDEILGIADMKTENYCTDPDNTGVNYGTDQPEELSDRLKNPVQRGPDHPHEVGKAPVEGDNTIMGKGSVQFSIPSIGKRGMIDEASATSSNVEVGEDQPVFDFLKFEIEDTKFDPACEFIGARVGMLFKKGEQGLGYYSDHLSAMKS
eukprot:CAMPEP_0116012476 /NCGR_PEP_ID=MMETSP0321-20121206/5148_1 /TAXON_ID=163516 /ORGANISM="Leptocylindrus danicus var. danicus, Strain B650" /LENGTH=659 /DNA_ID=CAMNT_0003481831 /DNA_START=22 /DNA_END=2001 /DNA_ORIENTATION=-